MPGSADEQPERRILIVDDDQDFADSLADILGTLGYFSETANSANAALALVRTDAPPVALVDLRLGVTSGMDLLQQLRAERPDLICVVMTAHADAKTAIEALRKGAYDYFDKTCQPNELVAVLARCFEKIQLRSDRAAAYEALRAARDEAEAANRAKSEFLATISHELRTPLNAIIGFSEEMMMQSLGPLGGEQYVGYAKDIFASGTHLLSLINDILDLSKAEAGRLELRESEMDIVEAVESVCRLLRPRAQEAGLTLSFTPPESAPLVWLDERRFKQTLLNLVGNAVKFTPEGGRIDVFASIACGAEVRICVRDTGIGMTQDDLARAVQPFVQIESALNRRHAGTGLGLPLVAAVMELHGGELVLESAPGIGTSAALVFPSTRVLAAAEPPTGSSASPHSEVVRRRVLTAA